jgi:large subunit ribosomal protein L29
MLNVNELKKLDKKALIKKIAEMKKQVFEIKFSKYTTGIEKSHVLKNLKKDIAKCFTVINANRAGE